MRGSYDFRLVALSVAISVLAAYAAIDLAGRVTAAPRMKERMPWLLGGAMSLGLGIWAMHYVGMLAFRMPMAVFYHLPTVLLSLLVAMGGAAVVLHTVSLENAGWKGIFLGSVLMGSSISAMHFVGMAAMRMQAVVSYDPSLSAFSIAAAIAVSFVSLALAFQVRKGEGFSWKRVGSAFAMGIAVASMHYIGMASASFHTSNILPELEGTTEVSGAGIGLIVAITVVVLLSSILAAFAGRYMAARKAALDVSRESESSFRSLAEAIPEIIWTAAPDGTVDYFNQRWYEYSGHAFDNLKSSSWLPVVHPDDLPECSRKWELSAQTGEPFESEHRLRRASDGAYRWHLARAVLLRDSNGTVRRWVGTATDIDHQKTNQQTLEHEVRKSTAELVTANEQLLREMREKEDAQKEVNRQSEQLVRQLTESSKRDSTLRRMGELLQSCSNMPEAYSIVLGFAPKMFPEFRGALLLLNELKTEMEGAGTWGDYELSAPTYDAHACWALRTGRVNVVEKGETLASCPYADGVTNSYFCIPIQAQSETVGILYFESLNGTSRGLESQLTMPNRFTEQIGLSIANIRLREMLKNQSIRDVLTGLFNRRYLSEVFEKEIRRAERSRSTLGVIMLDLDRFKSLNDTFGHSAGDCVLQELAFVLSKSIRSGERRVPIWR